VNSRILLSTVVTLACVDRRSSRPEKVQARNQTVCLALKADSLPLVYRSTDWGPFTNYPLPDSVALEPGSLGVREIDHRRQYSLRAWYMSSVQRERMIALTWTPITPDSIQALVWADGFKTIFLALGRRDTGLVGAATWGTDDMSAPRPSAPVLAVLVPCSELAGQWPNR